MSHSRAFKFAMILAIATGLYSSSQKAFAIEDDLSEKSETTLNQDQVPLSVDLYSQNVYLYKYDDLITQNNFTLTHNKEWQEFYIGMYFDADSKSNNKATYTDSQVSPLAGYKTPQLFSNILPTRFFGEGRLVNRLHTFTDGRKKNDTEARLGAYGYDLIPVAFNNPLSVEGFFEHYYSVFYSQLYNEQVLAQAWSKQGVRKQLGVVSVDLFNEFLYDSFDLSRKEQALLDIRPGVRASVRYKNIAASLTPQYMIHLKNQAQIGANEWRTLFVFSSFF